MNKPVKRARNIDRILLVSAIATLISANYIVFNPDSNTTIPRIVMSISLLAAVVMGWIKESLADWIMIAAETHVEIICRRRESNGSLWVLLATALFLIGIIWPLGPSPSAGILLPHYAFWTAALICAIKAFVIAFRRRPDEELNT